MLALLALVQSSFESAWLAEATLATSASRRAAVARIGVPYLRGQEEQRDEERRRLGDPQRQAAA
jgi:hypothetical protein